MHFTLLHPNLNGYLAIPTPRVNNPKMAPNMPTYRFPRCMPWGCWTVIADLDDPFAGVGYYLPGQPVTSEVINRRIDESTWYKLTDGLILQLIGVKSRYHRADDE